jgi:hypothetical protein
MLGHVPKTARIENPSQQQQIQQWLAAHGTPQQVALRCLIIWAAAEGHAESAIATQLGTNRKTVTLWRSRFAAHGLESLWQIAPGRGRKPAYGPEKIKAIVDATLQTKPSGMTHWSCRLMAKAQGVSKSTVSNVWRSHHLKPHRVKRVQAVGRYVIRPRSLNVGLFQPRPTVRSTMAKPR